MRLTLASNCEVRDATILDNDVEPDDDNPIQFFTHEYGRPLPCGEAGSIPSDSWRSFAFIELYLDFMPCPSGADGAVPFVPAPLSYSTYLKNEGFRPSLTR